MSRAKKSHRDFRDHRINFTFAASFTSLPSDTLNVATHTLRLAVVDDDGDIREIVQLLLQVAFPHALTSTHSSAEDALASLDFHELHLLITDCDMPTIDGPTLVKHLREEGHSLPIIMLSGDVRAREYGQAAGADYFVEKRHMFTELPLVIERLLAPVALA